jgi:hypothetical protein
MGSKSPVPGRMLAQKARYRIGYNLYEFLRNLLGADF